MRTWGNNIGPKDNTYGYTGGGDESDDPAEGQCLNCEGPSDCPTEIVEADELGNLSYFCGPDCRMEYRGEEEE